MELITNVLNFIIDNFWILLLIGVLYSIKTYRQVVPYVVLVNFIVGGGKWPWYAIAILIALLIIFTDYDNNVAASAIKGSTRPKRVDPDYTPKK